MRDIHSKVGDEVREAGWKERLRAGDPAPEMTPLAEDEVRAMRRAMLNAQPDERRSPWRLPLLAATALAALLGLAVGLRIWRLGSGPGGSGEDAPRVAVAPTTGSSAGAPGSRDVSGGSEPRAGAGSPQPLGAAGLAGEPGAPGRSVSRDRLVPPTASAGGSRAGLLGSTPHVTQTRDAAPPRLASKPPRGLLGDAPRGSSREPAPDAGTRPATSLASSTGVAPPPLAAPVQTRRELQFSTPGGTRIVWVFASGDAPASATPRPSRL